MSHLNRAPVAAEQTLMNLPVEGSLPQGLAGTLYRNGPNPLHPEATPHWFFGDGMVHAFHIRNGRATYRNRWVHTRLWANGTGAPAESLPDGVANTNIVSHAGALLALEEAHLPVMLDQACLGTIGAQDFNGALPAGPFTAHPKTCPLTGNLVFFGYGAHGMGSPTIRLGEITPAGDMLWLDQVTAPYGAMIHDFAVSAHHIAIPLFPLVIDLAKGAILWDQARGNFLGIIDRARGPGSLRWLPAPSGFAYHTANAWDEDGILTIDLMRSDAPQFFPSASAEAEPASTEAFLTRWQADLNAAHPQITQHRLSATEGEFPRIDERWSGRRNRHVFFSAGHALHARDDLTQAEQTFTANAGDSISEPVFVRAGPNEGHGHLLATLFRAATNTSEMIVLNATNLAAGPIATVKLPVRVPDGFHGAWVGDAS
jgi:carotenoid cleavage dioxygenase-like enzyme